MKHVGLALSLLPGVFLDAWVDGSRAVCGATQEQQDETSLVQVKKTITFGNARFNGSGPGAKEVTSSAASLKAGDAMAQSRVNQTFSVEGEARRGSLLKQNEMDVWLAKADFSGRARFFKDFASRTSGKIHERHSPGKAQDGQGVHELQDKAPATRKLTPYRSIGPKTLGKLDQKGSLGTPGGGEAVVELQEKYPAKEQIVMPEGHGQSSTQKSFHRVSAGSARGAKAIANLQEGASEKNAKHKVNSPRGVVLHKSRRAQRREKWISNFAKFEKWKAQADVAKKASEKNELAEYAQALKTGGTALKRKSKKRKKRSAQDHVDLFVPKPPRRTDYWSDENRHKRRKKFFWR